MKQLKFVLAVGVLLATASGASSDGPAGPVSVHAAPPPDAYRFAHTDEYLPSWLPGPYREVRGTCIGILEPFTAFTGVLFGDMTGREQSSYIPIFYPWQGTVRLIGETKVVTEQGTMFVTDDIMLCPGSARTTMTWSGLHLIRGGTGDFVRCTGVKHSRGLLDLVTGEVKFSYEGEICQHGLFGPK